MTGGPVRASRLPVAGQCHPRGASRPFLGRLAEMLRIRFYNRRFASRAPAENTLLPSSHRSRAAFMAACASTTSADRCFNEHDDGPLEHPLPRQQQGWPPLSIERCLSIDGDRRRSSGSGVEDHRASAFPPGIAPERDFAPTPIASDTSRRGYCLSPCLESTRVTGEAAGAASTNKRAQRESDASPDLREEIRRAVARGAFRRKAVRGRERRSPGVSRFDRSLPRLFHCKEHRARDARPGTCSLASR